MTTTSTTATPAGPLSPEEIDEAFQHLARTTGWSFYGARLALAKGHTGAAHRMLRRALAAHRAGDLPHIRQLTFDGMSPADLLAAVAALPRDTR